MSSKAISDLAKQVADTINNLVEQGAQARLKELIAGITEGVPTSSRAAARTSVAATGGVRKKRNYRRKPCPVPGCKNLAAPRHSMVCVDHKALSDREKDQYKAQAVAPGGVWYTEFRERKRKAA